MPDDIPSPDASGDPSSNAPPGADPGAVQSGGEAGPGQPGVLPPTGGPGAVDQSVPQQGQEALGREIMRKVVGLMHFARGMFSPFSDESKSTDSAIRSLLKHFKPDAEAAQQGQAQMPQMSPGAQSPDQGGGGAMPPMAGAGGSPGPAQPPSGPIPRLTGAAA